jgi:opacity protein-like surface antigen
MMKKICTIAALTFVFAAGNAVAESSYPYYVKLLGKYTRMSDMDITNQLQLDSDEGYGFGGAFGVQIDWFKIEAEIATQENDLNNFEFRGVGGARSFDTADTGIDTLMVNAFVDIPVVDDFSVFAGGGIGGAEVSVSARDFDADENVWAWKLAAGVCYNFSDEWGAEFGYEYLATDDVEYNFVDVEDISSSNLTFAIKYMF